MMLVAALAVLGMVSMSEADMMMPRCSAMPPTQFSVGLQIVTTELKAGSSEPTVRVNTLSIEQDMDRNMTRYAGMVSTYIGLNVTHANYSVVNDFNMGKQYNFGMSDGHLYCTVNHLDMMETKMLTHYCVPENLTFHESVVFGSGDESVRVHSWDGMSGGMMWSVQTTVDGVDPISYNKFGTNDDGTMMTESGLYGNAMANLTMPDPFMVPSECMSMTFNIGNLPG